MSKFSEFLNKKTRDARKQLGIVGRVLQKDGFNVKENLESNDPFIYVANPGKKISFGGIRIYKIGNSIAYRVQKEEKTHPYGTSYPLSVEEMFDDYLSDMKEEEAGKNVMKAISSEVRSFFERSTEAEKELRATELERQADVGKSAIKSTNTDYANTLFNSKTSSPL